MMAQAWGRNYSPFNKHIHKSVLVMIGDFLDHWKSTKLDIIPVSNTRNYYEIILFVLKYVFKNTLTQ